jgi:hypothetical protein
VLVKFGGFDERMRQGAEDFDLWHRILRHGYVWLFSGTTGGAYRQKQHSMVRAMPEHHVREAMRLMRKAETPLAAEEVLPGTRQVFDQPLGYHQNVILRTRRLARFGAMAYLGGNSEGFEAILKYLEPNSWFYIGPSILKRELDAGCARYHGLLNQNGAEPDVPNWPAQREEILSRFRSIMGKPYSPAQRQRSEADSAKGPKQNASGEATMPESCEKPEASTDEGNPSATAEPKKERQVHLDGIPDRPTNQPVASTYLLVPDRKDYVRLEEDPSAAPDADSIRRFRNIHAHQRCFIIGNGPSLNKIDLSRLENEISIGVNGIFYKTDESGFKPTYYVVEDSRVMRDNRERIVSYDVRHKFFPTLYRKFVPASDQVSFFRLNRGFYEKNSPNYAIPRFSTDFTERAYCGQSVTYINLQLAWYMGFSQVYLIGMDFSYTIPKSAIVDGVVITSTEDDPNHFHPEYFGKGKQWADPKLDFVARNYLKADMVYKFSGRQIFNASVGGKLEVFDRVNFDSLF